ncbi:MAG: hypothetical protein ACO1SV_14330 [Fimbriimonas sp.]
MPPRDRTAVLERRVRYLIVGFIIGLALSGITAFPLPQELTWLTGQLGIEPGATGLRGWILTVKDALVDTEGKYPFLFYGYDWLAFAHLVIALLFVGPLRDPVRNIWVIHWGMMACVAIFPLAFICGAIRGIPFGWQLIDCSFGVVGIVPLYVCDRAIREIERLRGN